VFKGKIKSYSTKVDLWSAGVLLFVMLEGDLPWGHGVSDKVACARIAKREVTISPDGGLSQCSRQVHDLLMNGLLVVDPKDRFHVEQALEHGWLDDKKEVLGRLFRKMLEKCEWTI